MRSAAFLPLLMGCLAPAKAPEAPPGRDDVSRLAREAGAAARACDLERARSTYALANTLCTDCTPQERVQLEQVRVHAALLAGEPREPTLASGAQVARQLEARDPLAAARLFAELGRLQSPELLERAVQILTQENLPARTSAAEALGVLIIDPDIVTRGGAARAWPARYELQHYQWQADDAADGPDARYAQDACPDALPASGASPIPNAQSVIFGQRIIYVECLGKSAVNALPGQRLDGTARMQFKVGATGRVNRIKVYGAFLPETLVTCIGETIRSKQFDSTAHGGTEDVLFRFTP